LEKIAKYNIHVLQNKLHGSSGRKKVIITVSREALEKVGKIPGIGNKSRLIFVHYMNNELFPSKYNISQVNVVT